MFGFCHTDFEPMRTYKEYIEELKEKYVGKPVVYEGKSYTVVDVDYNGGLLIDKPAEHTATTAIPITAI